MSDELPIPTLTKCGRCGVVTSQVVLCKRCLPTDASDVADDPNYLSPLEQAVWAAAYASWFKQLYSGQGYDAEDSARSAASESWAAVDALRKHGGRR